MRSGEIARLTTTLSRWGRWGAEDERGALNFIGPDQARKAARLVSTGQLVSLARPIDPRIPDVYGPPQRLLLAGGSGPPVEQPPRSPDLHHSSVEYVSLAFHGLTITHLDAPSHVDHDGRIYNGRPASAVDFADGARASAVTAALPGIFTRGVVLDLPGLRGVQALEPGYGVRPGEIEDCERRQGVVVGTGDVVLLHTGARATVPPDPAGMPGFHWTCLPWLAEREVAAIGSDRINDVIPSGVAADGFALPIHVFGLVYMGLWLLDSCDTTSLVTTCRELGRWEFALSVSPLHLAGATGSPVNPVAIF